MNRIVFHLCLIAVLISLHSFGETTEPVEESESSKPGNEIARSTNSTILELRPDGLVLVSNPTATEYRINEVICLRAGKKNLVCGYVIQTQSSGVLVAPSKSKAQKLQAGDTVLIVRRPRSPASTQPTLGITGPRTQEQPSLNSLSVGANWTRPFLRFEQSISPHAAIGLNLDWLNLQPNNSVGTGFAALTTISYYPSEVFRGFWAGFGGGFYVLTAPRYSSAFFTGWAVAGYRFLLKRNYHITVGAGGQYLFTPQPPNWPKTISRFSPWTFLELGMLF